MLRDRRVIEFVIIAGVSILCVFAGRWLSSGTKQKEEGWHFVQSEISLGKMTKDQTAPVVFQITNESDEPIKITSAEDSCRCTTLEYAPEVIPAHGTEAFKWEFSASRSEGAVSQTVTVEADDGRTLDGTFTAVVGAP